MSENHLVPWTPTEAMWGGLARAIMMGWDLGARTPRELFRHLERSVDEIPQWLRDEPEMKNLDHVPSKGTRCVLIYRAMLQDCRREKLRELTALGEDLEPDPRP